MKKAPLLLTLFLLAGLVPLAPTAEAQPRTRGRQQATPQRATTVKATARVRTATQGRTTGTTTRLRTEAKLQHREANQKSLNDVLKTSGSTFFTREVGGAKRLIANVSGQEALNSVSKATLSRNQPSNE